MTTHRELHSFSIPRCEAVPVPGVASIVRHPPPPNFPVLDLKPNNALAADLGNIWPLEYEPSLPYRERSRGLPIGRVVAYRDGIIFLPNTNKAVLADLGKEMKQLVSFMAADLDMKALFATGDGKEIAEALGEALEHLEELVWGEDEGRPHRRAHDDAAPNEITKSIRSSLAKSGSIVLPYAQLVKIAVIEASPETWWQKMTFPKRKLLYLLREDADGARAAYCFSLAPDENKKVPFAYYSNISSYLSPGATGDYASGKLSWTEALATVFAGARAASDIGALWLAAERERLDENALRAIRAQASAMADPAKRAVYVAGAVGEERKRRGTTDAAIARSVLERLGDCAGAFDAAPFARHAIVNPVAALRKTAGS